jgi:hypothetical protein
MEYIVSSSSDLLVSTGFSVSHHFCADQPLSLACRSMSTMPCFSAAASGGDLFVFNFFCYLFFVLVVLAFGSRTCVVS